jgi:hypothetical protein
LQADDLRCNASIEDKSSEATYIKSGNYPDHNATISGGLSGRDVFVAETQG